MEKDKYYSADEADDNIWIQMAKEVESDRKTNIDPQILHETIQTYFEEKEVKRDDKADLQIWQRIPIGSKGSVETEWRENATISELEERKDFENQISEISNLYRNSENWNRDREGAVESARQLLTSQKYSKYAVTAAIGPSIIMDIIEKSPDIMGDFDMGAFVSKLSDSELDKNSTWELNCRALIATQLERYTSPNLGVNIEKFIDSENTQTKLSTLDHILNIKPDFDTEEFLTTACEDEPAIVCSNANSYLKLGIDFPITEIERKLQVETKQKVKNEPDDKWKKYYVDDFNTIISRLITTYDQYGKLSEDTRNRINQELDRFYKDTLNAERNPQEEIALGDILQETIDSFNEKYQDYQEQYAKLDRQYYSVYHDVNEKTGKKLTVTEYREECEKLAKETIANLDEMELSYFRREFIRRSHLYEGDESHANAGEKIKNGNSEEYYLMESLYDADENFRKSNEYRIYNKRRLEKEKKEFTAELEAMTEEELRALRKQRLEFELNGNDPVPYKKEDGDIDWEKYAQNKHIKKLWDYDSGWEESEEGQEYTKNRREKWADEAAKEWAELLVKYPDIFKNPDLDEIDRLVDETIAKIPRDKIYEIGKLKESGKYRQADQTEINLFVDIFGLKYRPYIEYSDKETECSGSYAHRLKKIEVRRKFGGRDDENDITNTIAHEMWHAHQHDEEDRDTERGKKYKINSDHYQNGQPGWDIVDDDMPWSKAYDRYRNQLLEIESFTFGQAFADYYRDVMENGVDTSKDLSSEIDNLIKEKQKTETIKKMSPENILNNLSNLREKGFSDKEITDYLAHCYSFSTENGEIIVNTMIDNHIDIPYYDQDNEDIDYDIEYGSKLMVKNANKLLESGISETDIIDSLYYDDANLDFIQYNDGVSRGRRSFFNNVSTTWMNGEIIYRSTGFQDLLLTIYQNETRHSNITKARNRIEKAISHYQDLRGVESTDQREKEKTEYLFEMLERLVEEQ